MALYGLDTRRQHVHYELYQHQSVSVSDLQVSSPCLELRGGRGSFVALHMYTIVLSSVSLGLEQYAKLHHSLRRGLRKPLRCTRLF